MSELYTYEKTSNGFRARLKRRSKVDEQRIKLAEKMGLTYEGILYPNKTLKPTMVKLLFSFHGIRFTMSYSTFKNKLKVILGEIKRNSDSENVFLQALKDLKIPFCREFSLEGIEFSEGLEDEETYAMLRAVSRIKRAIRDFLILKPNGTKVLLSIIDSGHSYQKDDDWEFFENDVKDILDKLNIELHDFIVERDTMTPDEIYQDILKYLEEDILGKKISAKEEILIQNDCFYKNVENIFDDKICIPKKKEDAVRIFLEVCNKYY